MAYVSLCSSSCLKAGAFNEFLPFKRLECNFVRGGAEAISMQPNFMKFSCCTLVLQDASCSPHPWRALMWTSPRTLPSPRHSCIPLSSRPGVHKVIRTRLRGNIRPGRRLHTTAVLICLAATSRTYTALLWSPSAMLRTQNTANATYSDLTAMTSGRRLLQVDQHATFTKLKRVHTGSGAGPNMCQGQTTKSQDLLVCFIGFQPASSTM